MALREHGGQLAETLPAGVREGCAGETAPRVGGYAFVYAALARVVRVVEVVV
jgi:hypothetical protein